MAETAAEFSARLLRDHPNAPVCKGCNCVLVGNEKFWKRDGADVYCCNRCYWANGAH
jgi:hypothetical protein